MIKEHDEMSEEDQDEETCNEDEAGNQRGHRMSPPYHKQGGSNNKKPYETQEQQQSQAYPQGDGRPTNRLGCSRAFHQMNSTKDGWKDGHSFPRTQQPP